jgi:glycosyltransferase involved in cell wall biosynthesis
MTQDFIGTEITRKKISIVVPMYNEEEVIQIFFTEILKVMNQLPLDWEIVCVNDGSRDHTWELLLQWHNSDPRIKVINLSRNFGKERALTAAIDYATGDAVIPIDVDLQDPPEIIPLMVQRWLEGYDVVNAVRSQRKHDTVLKRTTARMFYKVINSISDVDIPSDVGDFRLLSKRACNALRSMRERRRFMKGLFSWVGYPTTTVTYERKPRAAGSTKFNYWKLWNFAIEGIASFSTVPLKIATYIGLMYAVLSLIYAAYMIIDTLIFGNAVAGYPSLMTAILFFGGVQLIFIGIIGEYIGRIHDEVKYRPIYFVESIYGFDATLSDIGNVTNCVGSR